VNISQSGTPAKAARFHFNPIDEQKRPLSMVDKDGNPVTTEQYQSRMHEGLRAGKSPQDLSTAMATGGTMFDGNKYQLVLYVNPAKVSALQIRANYTRIIDISGIPMDPK
jgi:hypothetical protein